MDPTGRPRLLAPAAVHQLQVLPPQVHPSAQSMLNHLEGRGCAGASLRDSLYWVVFPSRNRGMAERQVGDHQFNTHPLCPTLRSPEPSRRPSDVPTQLCLVCLVCDGLKLLLTAKTGSWELCPSH